jgi:hypothetical protein
MTGIRLKRIDDGHYLVPGTDWEVVREADGRWAIFEGSERIAGPFETYALARQWAVKG